MRFPKLTITLALTIAVAATGQTLAQTTPSQTKPPARADVLRGEYGPYRANNDLLFYHLNVRVDPEKKFLIGKTTIRFRMLKDDTRIQIDLQRPMEVEKILLLSPKSNVRSPTSGTELKYVREEGAVFIDFPQTLRAGRVYTIDFHYSGYPKDVGRFDGFAFKKDPQGRHWINTACEGPGASTWWPNKDQWRDEVESMRISVAIPNNLVDVSNGRFQAKTDLGDGYTRWDWLVHYPINNYNVSVNIGHYAHFSDHLNDHNDKRWWTLLRSFYQLFKYQNIMTEDVVAFFNRGTGTNLTPVFDQYLRHTAVPILELKFDEARGEVSYRWKVDEAKFAMPVRVGEKDRWQVIRPTTAWQTMKSPLKKSEFAVATDLYFVNVSKS